MKSLHTADLDDALEAELLDVDPTACASARLSEVFAQVSRISRGSKKIAI